MVSQFLGLRAERGLPGCSRCRASSSAFRKHFLGSATSLRPANHRSYVKCRTTRLAVEANELNKWGDTDGRENDTDEGILDDGFERDTVKILMNVLTVRATQKLLMQLQELDVVVASWLSNFCSEHPPGKGDEFLLALLKEGAADIVDKANQTSHAVSPTDLFDRVLAVRADMAVRIGKEFQKIVTLDSQQLKIKHLSQSYVSGSTTSDRRRGSNPH